MAWHDIPYSNWEFNDTPVEPPEYNIGQHYLWSLQVNGVRTNANGIQIYTECRLKGSTVQTMGELNKTHWDWVAKVETSPVLSFSDNEILTINNSTLIM